MRYLYSVDTRGYSYTLFYGEEITVGNFTKEPQTSRNGPSWFDVKVQWQETETLVGGPIEVRTILSSSVGNKPTYILRAVIRGVPCYSRGSSFTQGSSEGPQTMPAAIYQLLTKVYHWWEEMDGEQIVIFLNDEPKG